MYLIAPLLWLVTLATTMAPAQAQPGVFLALQNKPTGGYMAPRGGGQQQQQHTLERRTTKNQQLPSHRTLEEGIGYSYYSYGEQRL